MTEFPNNIHRFFQGKNDQIIYDMLKNKQLSHLGLELDKPGIFVEIGALDGYINSNTYFFEKILDWKGILTESDSRLCQYAKKNRWYGVFNGVIGKNNGYICALDNNNNKLFLPSLKLNSLFTSYNLNNIDYLAINYNDSLDILENYKDSSAKIISLLIYTNKENTLAWFEKNNYKKVYEHDSNYIFIKK